jgi:hypothetical protein
MSNRAYKQPETTHWADQITQKVVSKKVSEKKSLIWFLPSLGSGLRISCASPSRFFNCRSNGLVTSFCIMWFFWTRKRVREYFFGKLWRSDSISPKWLCLEPNIVGIEGGIEVSSSFNGSPIGRGKQPANWSYPQFLVVNFLIQVTWFQGSQGGSSAAKGPSFGLFRTTFVLRLDIAF